MFESGKESLPLRRTRQIRENPKVETFRIRKIGTATFGRVVQRRIVLRLMFDQGTAIGAGLRMEAAGAAG